MNLPSHPSAPTTRPQRPPQTPPSPDGRCGLTLATLTVAVTALTTAGATLLRSVIARVSASQVQPTEPVEEPSPSDAPGPFAELVYELLDAHADTAELARRVELDDDWLAHLAYLRSLQREGRRMLAEMSLQPIP